MHRSRAFTNPPAASRLPPLCAAGWLVDILSETDHRRDDRFRLGVVIDRPPPASIEPARPASKARRRKQRFAPVLAWLHRVLRLQARRA